MKKLWVFGMFMLMVSNSTFAGGLLTNTNQHVSFLRMIARGASTDIDGVYSNPAGLAYLNDGIHLSMNIQSAYQTRVINADFPNFWDGTRKYKGTASAPVIPSFQAAYKVGDWTISGSFAVTGGGGKASFNTGLPMFDSKIMALLAQKKVTPDMYSINTAMDGKQFIYGLQLGLTYKITDYLAVFAGGRMNYVNSGYEGYLDAALKGGTSLVNIALDCDQVGWGVTPVIGADVKLGKFNLGLKYEFMTNVNMENKTKMSYTPNEDALKNALAPYAHGANTPNDIPALLTAGLGYDILPTLRATIEYHYFFDKDAEMANGKQKALTGGTNEYLIGAEWDMNNYLTVSGGYQKTDYGLSNDFQSDTSFSCDSYSVGLGAAIKFSPKVTLNVAYFWTNYSDYTKDVKATGTPGTGYNGTGLAGKDVFTRTNKVFGIGLDYKF
jgi:long-chain fatty acid transport protein